MYKLAVLERSCVLCHRQKRLHEFTRRQVYNLTGKWTETLDRDVRLNIEKYWKDKLRDVDVSISNQASVFCHLLWSVAEVPHPSPNPNPVSLNPKLFTVASDHRLSSARLLGTLKHCLNVI